MTDRRHTVGRRSTDCDATELLATLKMLIADRVGVQRRRSFEEMVIHLAAEELTEGELRDLGL